MKYCCKEYFWRDRQPCLKEQSDAQAWIKLSTLFSLFARVYRFSQQQFINSNFVWNQDEVSQNSRYAKRFYYSRQLSAQTVRHFYDSGHSFAKIAIPCTIYPSLNLLAFLSISVVLQTRVLDARIKNICACSVSLEICQL